MAGNIIHKFFPLPADLKKRGITKNKYLAPLLQRLYDSAINIVVEGLDITSIPGGFKLRAQGGGGSSDADNFHGTLLTIEDVLCFSLTPGALLPVAGTPTLGGISLDTLPRPTLPLYGGGTGNAEVYLHLKLDLLTANGYVYGWNFNAVTIETGSVTPDDDQETGDYYLRIFQTIDDVIQRPQPVRTSLAFFIEDTGLADSTARCYFMRA